MYRFSVKCFHSILDTIDYCKIALLIHILNFRTSTDLFNSIFVAKYQFQCTILFILGNILSLHYLNSINT